MENPAVTDYSVADIIKRRWSPRALSDKPIERDKIMSLLEAARWAPSCYNEQPWRYLLFDETNADAREKARACLVDGNSWARVAPVLLLSVAKETFTKNGKANRHAQHDVGLASENLVLQATELGLATHQMAGFDAEKARREFHIPEGFTPMAFIAVAYPGDAEEGATRSRKPISEIMRKF